MQASRECLLLICISLCSPLMGRSAYRQTVHVGSSQSGPEHQIGIDPLSVRSLLLGVFSHGQSLGTATGFVV